jgi:hypothetical protein
MFAKKLIYQINIGKNLQICKKFKYNLPIFVNFGGIGTLSLFPSLKLLSVLRNLEISTMERYTAENCLEKSPKNVVWFLTDLSRLKLPFKCTRQDQLNEVYIKLSAGNSRNGFLETYTHVGT